MTHAFTISYMDCQTCRTRIHCDECEERISEMLMRIDGVENAATQMAKKQLCVDTVLNRDALEEMLEDLGIFVE